MTFTASEGHTSPPSSPSLPFAKEREGESAEHLGGLLSNLVLNGYLGRPRKLGEKKCQGCLCFERVWRKKDFLLSLVYSTCLGDVSVVVG